MARILIIDDQDDVREVLKTLLEEQGHEVGVAPEGAEGIRLHRSEPADLIITDLHMPGKNGLETLQELRDESETLKLIAMSGGDTYMYETNLESSRINGADLTFVKPFDIPKFLAAIEDLLAEQVTQ